MSQGPVRNGQGFALIGDALSTLGIASAVSIGSNWLDVRHGAITPNQAILNGVAKGAAATLILKATSRSTPLQIVLAMGVLAGAGFLIDSAMKKDKRELCAITVETTG